MQNFLLAQVTEINDKNWVKVKFVDYNNITCKEFIPIMLSPIGEAKEGISGPLAVDDLVVVAFFDDKYQNPFVLGKIHTSSEFIANKKIRFHEHEMEFTADNITITHKDGTVITVESDKVKFTSPTAFGDITFGGLGLFQFLAALTCVGNLGLPAPVDPTQITQITNAIANSSEVIIGT